MVKIRNKDQLLSNARSPVDRRAREVALNVVEEAIDAVDPRKAVKLRVVLAGNLLKVNGKSLDLSGYRRIFVVGGGKASGAMAQALEEILGDRIEDGLVLVPRGTANSHRTKRVRLHESSHPIPDESSVTGATKLMDFASHAGEDDLVICLISGGGSSLMALPRDGISLGDKQKVTDLLLKSGATINEINAVRKHISRIKGGQLAECIHPATLLSLILSDIVGDPVDMIASGPTTPDSTTFRDATNVLERYSVWEKTPASIREVLSDGVRGLIQETPKKENPVFDRAHNVVIGSNRLACETATKRLRESGLNTLFLTSFLEGEARNVGFWIGTVAKEIRTSGNPVPRPAAIVLGGETTVTVTGGGTCGRNQEIALGAALKIDGVEGVVVASVTTDGIDGPTDAAGAICDSSTIPRSRELRLDANEYLRNNDSHSFFLRLGDLVCTGSTGTNVNDITILIAL